MPAPRDTDEWTEAVQGLLADSDAARERLGRGARAVVGRQYSYDAWRSRWTAALELPGAPS
jgi:hypothetical protein